MGSRRDPKLFATHVRKRKGAHVLVIGLSNKPPSSLGGPDDA